MSYTRLAQSGNTNQYVVHVDKRVCSGLIVQLLRYELSVVWLGRKQAYSHHIRRLKQEILKHRE